VQFALESRMDSAEQVACWRRTAQRAGGKLVGDALDAGQLANAAAHVRQRL